MTLLTAEQIEAFRRIAKQTFKGPRVDDICDAAKRSLQIPEEPTEEQFKKAAEILEADSDARYAFTWLWNSADTQWVRSGYFMRFLKCSHRAMLRAK